jgi:hypothetical protein
MMPFEHYIKTGKVTSIAKNEILATSIVKQVEFREKVVATLKMDIQSLLIFEGYYDCLRELCDAILALDGYKSYSHEACIIYLKKYGVNDVVLDIFDQFRKDRNDSKYYGKILTQENAEKIKAFYMSNAKILLGIIKKRCKC